jgi:predicted outer membrane protein
MQQHTRLSSGDDRLTDSLPYGEFEMRIWTLSLACVSMLFIGSQLAAQQRAPENPTNRQPQREVAPDKTNIVPGEGRDHVADLATWLAAGNHAEVELGKLAVERSDNAAVKQFAEQMIDEHSKYLGKLQQFVPGERQGSTTTTNRTTRETSPGATDSPRRELDPPARNDTRPADPDRAATDPNRAGELRGQDTVRSTTVQTRTHAGSHDNVIMQVGMDACHRKLQMTKELLEEYQGQDFDMGYLGQQIIAHVEMLATLKAMENHGTPEFQQVVKEGIQRTEAHLKHAKAIASRLEDKEGGEQVRPRTTEPQPPIRE